MKSNTSYMIKFGGILGGVSVIFAVMLFTLDMHYGQEPLVNYVNYAISIGVMKELQFLKFLQQAQKFYPKLSI